MRLIAIAAIPARAAFASGFESAAPSRTAGPLAHVARAA
jgi:hypothetical protein